MKDCFCTSENEEWNWIKDQCVTTEGMKTRGYHLNSRTGDAAKDECETQGGKWSAAFETCMMT